MSDKKYMFQKVSWIFNCDPRPSYCSRVDYMDGPYCLKCNHSMLFKEVMPFEDVVLQSGKLVCKNRNCDNSVQTKYRSESELRESAHDSFHANARGLIDTISLDLPPTKLKTKDKDDNYFVTTELTQSKDGRRIAVIYIGEISKKQGKKDRIQLFADIDQQQLRFDSTDQSLGVLLAKIECEFKDSKTEIKLKDNL